jgi:hypothetical protein
MKFVVLALAVLGGFQTLTDDERAALRAVLPLIERLTQPQPPVYMVNTAAGLQQAINTVPGGATIEIAPGTYIGNFTLPQKQQQVTIEGCGGVELRSPSNAPVIQTLANGDNWKIVGCSDTDRLTLSQVTSGYLVRLGTHLQTQAEIPQNHHFEYVHFKGDPITGSRRGIVLHSINATVTHSRFTDFKQAGQDTQCIGGWNGPGPYTITFNYCEGAGENIMFGGADPSITGMLPCDILIADNTLVKPASWKGSSWTVKNLIEFKSGCRVQIIGNTLDGVWPPGQDGFAVLLKSTNQYGGCTWCKTEDIEIAHNTLVNVSGGFKLAGKPEANQAVRANTINIHDNVITVDSTLGGTGRCAQIMGVANVKFEYNDCQSATWANTIYVTEAGLNGGLILRGNILRDYTSSGGIKGDGQTEGVVSLNYYAAGYIFTGNLVISSQTTNYASSVNTVVATMPSSTTGFGPRPR